MVGKRIRTDEAPLQAGFRISGVSNLGRRPRICASQDMAQQSVEADATSTRRGFARIEHVSGLHHQVRGIRTHLLEPAQVEENRIALACPHFHRDVVDEAAIARANEQRRLSRVRIIAGSFKRSCMSFGAEAAHFSVVSVKLMLAIMSARRARESVQAERHM